MKITENGVLPKKATPFSAGYDLFSAVDCVVPKKGKYLISTGIALILPDGCYGRIAPRSSLALKYFIHVGAGVIDQVRYLHIHM